VLYECFVLCRVLLCVQWALLGPVQGLQMDNACLQMQLRGVCGLVNGGGFRCFWVQLYACLCAYIVSEPVLYSVCVCGDGVSADWQHSSPRNSVCCMTTQYCIIVDVRCL
jgi:hypothetical protein